MKAYAKALKDEVSTMREEVKTQTHYHCGFCNYSSLFKSRAEQHEKQMHTCQHESWSQIFFEAIQNDDELIDLAIARHCQSCSRIQQRYISETQVAEAIGQAQLLLLLERKD